MFLLIAFIVLKIFGVIGISWWWAVPAAIIGQLPLGNTAIFVLFKAANLFVLPVSIWWILLAIAADVIVIAGYAYQHTKK